ncbi:Uncharacterized conserved protein, contains NRDE domain [Noviherbaspirillum humi]|uniref:Uncharacterized conserved protein, contains NRDE domain n=1 Tax=Noviherbaspirillum humi TaxID=1688639 RepID=A0A239HAI6_9BURK|nr:NRDE family protein [Noviherbaspirillum humi]SNS78419.1 Uncharacterized conserved protein, contains NRDE domain [Noviherbaspirillum humi]
MCLIVFAWQVVPGTPLVAAANRDEFYDRPAAAAHWWEDSPQVYAGRDLEAGGTWMGITRDGRFAAITNIRAPSERRGDAPSRGRLVSDFLSGEVEPRDYVESLRSQAGAYNGFNLVVGNGKELIWLTNGRSDDPRNGQPLTPGVYGLSNAALDTAWPKVMKSRAQFSSLICQGAPEEAYFEMLADTSLAPDDDLPHTGVGLERERMLSAVCIESPAYGTRVSTLVCLHGDGSGMLVEKPVR